MYIEIRVQWNSVYADDPVIMAPTMEQLGRRVADWRASLLGKGLKVNAGKSKVMVGSRGGKMIVNSGKWPCGVCGKGVQANSVQCTVYKKWIHKRCSGVRGDLSRVADGFMCRRFDGTIQEVDLAEDLMVDGETYECVKSFCYLGDTLDGDGGADLAATGRIRNGWIYTISGSTALRCLVNRASFIILLGGSLVVMEKLTFSGCRHLAKYCADSSSECSFTFSMFASACS